MNNEEIHQSLPEKEVRDFLSKTLRDAHIIGALMPSEYYEKQLKKMQKLVEEAKKREAILSIIKSKGWDWYDISKYVKYDPEKYFDFIGTEEEYKKIFEK